VRLAWLSPAAGNSGIVEFSRQVLPAVARYAEPELWSHGAPQKPPPDIPTVDYASDPEALGRLASYDAVVYHLGNHLAFHRAEYDTSLRVPGVVVLHDRTLHHFFAAYYITYLRRPDLYLARMTALYGARGGEVGVAVIAQHGEQAWRTPDEVLEHAFIEDALANALGAVVHSAGHAAAVRTRWAGPLAHLPMPAYDSQLAVAVTPAPERTCSAAPVTLMSVGHVDRSKHVLTVIEALASAPQLAAQVRYVVVGQYDPRSPYVRDLHRTVADAGLAHGVRLLGYVPPATLRRHLATADVFVNLRFPNLESGSASLMEQLALGRPVVAYNGGAFGELPDGTVVTVPAGDTAALLGALDGLVGDAGLRARIGAAARAYAEHQRVDGYAHALVDFAGEADAWRARRRLADSVGEKLRGLDVDPGAPAVDRVAAEVDALLG
jgi:glycosyltransferase involved in cell wall biosynthesis